MLYLMRCIHKSNIIDLMETRWRQYVYPNTSTLIVNPSDNSHLVEDIGRRRLAATDAVGETRAVVSVAAEAEGGEVLKE